MKLITERTVGGAAGVGGCDGAEGEVVVVGMKFDAESRELLTWALMQVAKPGDLVIALHVLDSIAGGTASLLSLVKAFDSLLAVYEGFCNLKQVDLKIQVCRGSSAKKILVREAKSSSAAKVIVGTSKAHHKIHSSTSVAKYCARNLSKSLSVFAVSNGKIIFQREATVHHLRDKLNQKSHNCTHESQNKISEDSPLQLAFPDNSGTDLLDETHEDGDVDNSLALVPVQTSEAVSNFSSAVVERPPDCKKGWSILRRIFLPKRRHREKTNVKKKSAVKRVLKLPSSNSSSVVYPDKKQNMSYMKEDHCSNLEGDCGAIVPMMGPKVAWSPISPCHGSNALPEELKDLHEKYSSSCRLFSYEELCLATSNFMPGLFS
ncbi:uncharacterized protein LOC105650281 isoform X1 [Jatropha curcas]|uniref:uncharacterized protein LOC105650281 isoform X1 n=1 Tax=Jatropha curcas TaxID=180498 RepID=UPI001893D1B9|nr:uncharacterized protein LOC105650281 isoform X1 [Jatropha curcas]